MRAVVLLLLLASTAHADRFGRARLAREHGEAGSVDELREARDTDALGWLALVKSGLTRERALDALVELGRLSDKVRALVPTRETIERELGKGLSAGNVHRRMLGSIARRVLSAETCVIEAASPSALVVSCAHHGCDGACHAVEAAAELRVQKGKFSVRNVVVSNLGDTGECGCCMMVE